MGKGGSTQIVYQQPATDPAAQAAAAQSYSATQAETVTPAIAKSIAQDTESAQVQQLQARQRMRGVSSTYLRGTDLASTTAGGKAKLGQ